MSLNLRFLSLPAISLHFILFNFISCHLISFIHSISRDFISCSCLLHSISCHAISLHLTSVWFYFHPVSFQSIHGSDVISYHAIWFHDVSCHVVLFNFISCHVKLTLRLAYYETYLSRRHLGTRHESMMRLDLRVAAKDPRQHQCQRVVLRYQVLVTGFCRDGASAPHP